MIGSVGRESATEAARRIRSLRHPKAAVDPWAAHGSILEDERTPTGGIEHGLTIFLAGAECPFTCSFCDLWRWTLDGPTPAGALPAQIAAVLAEHKPPVPRRIKLYNASNFFDARAVPTEDLPGIARLCGDFDAVTVESHASTIDGRVVDFAHMLPGRLEVAIGLETIHPVALRQLNKRLDIDRFDRAAAFLSEHRIDMRVFVLVGVPYVDAHESVEWVVRTARHAAEQGARTIALIPVRGGNGEMERLAALGHFTPPTLAQLESALDGCADIASAVVTADLWDIDRLPACTACRAERVERLRRINRDAPQPRVICDECATTADPRRRLP